MQIVASKRDSNASEEGKCLQLKDRLALSSTRGSDAFNGTLARSRSCKLGQRPAIDEPPRQIEGSSLKSCFSLHRVELN